jgi:tRNA (cmo5U34)-methyltransferase
MGNVGDNIKTGNASWSFGGQVAEAFDYHVLKSVPLYNEGHGIIVKMSDFFLEEGSVCYDLGCSTGQLTCRIANHNKNKKVRFIAVDREDGMIEQARSKCKGLKSIDVLKSDLMDLELEKADFIISYYTMQFIRPKNRQIMIRRIYEALNWGGAFLLFEKVRGPDARFQDFMTAVYTDYKMEQGYLAEEIVEKSRSLKGILEPFSTQGNIDLLKRAGFIDIMTILKFACFEGFLAIK